MASADSLSTEITQVTEHFNQLRLSNAPKTELDEAKKKLGELKKSLALLKSAEGGGDGAKKKERLLLKTGKVRPIPRGAYSRVVECT